MTVGFDQFNDPLKAIKAQSRSSQTPYISANIFATETGAPLFNAYRLVTIDGLSIAIIGLTEPYPFKERQGMNVSGIYFMDPYKAAKELAPILEPYADILIASVHKSSTQVRPSALESIPSLDLVMELQPEPQNQPTLTRVDLEFLNGKLFVLNQKTFEILELTH